MVCTHPEEVPPCSCDGIRDMVVDHFLEARESGEAIYVVQAIANTTVQCDAQRGAGRNIDGKGSGISIKADLSCQGIALRPSSARNAQHRSNKQSDVHCRPPQSVS